MTMMVRKSMTRAIPTCISDGDGEESGEVGGVDGGDDEAEEPPGGGHDSRGDGAGRAVEGATQQRAPDVPETLPEVARALRFSERNK